MQKINVLILGGTMEARLLAENWPAEMKAVISYSGILGQTPELPIKTRVGSFGGLDGLVRFLKENQITHLIDATHPFASQVTKQALQASKNCQIPLMRLEREEWKKQLGDTWISVGNLGQAADQLQKMDGPVLITSGLKELDPFIPCLDKKLFVRTIPKSDLSRIPNQFKILTGKPPFDLEKEVNLLQKWQIKAIISKNSGGDQTYAKIQAARELNIPVIMVERPKNEGLKVYYDYEKLLDDLNRETQTRA